MSFIPVVSGLVGAVAGQLLAWLIEAMRRPSLVLDVGAKPPFEGTAQGNYGLQRWYRVRVVNKRLRQAESCRAYLTYLRRDGDAPVAENDALALWASSFGDAGPDKPITIPQGLTRYFDVLSISLTEAGTYSLEVCTSAGGSRFLKLDPGVYEVGVTVAGTGFMAKSIRYKFDFDGSDRPDITARGK